MLGVIVWAVILIIIIYRAFKNSAAQKKSYQNQNRKQELNRTFRNPPAQNTPFSGKKSAPARPKPQEDILTRSKVNLASAPARETLSDTAAAVPSYHDDENLMKTVEDLIVKGYEPNLTFERDFIAEGMDLLNRYY